MANAAAQPRRARIASPWLTAAALVALVSVVAAQELTQAQQNFQQGYAYHTGEGVDQDLETALRYYREALKLEPGMYEAHANAGRAYYATGKYRRAEHHLSQAITIAREREDLSEGDEAMIANDLGSCFYTEGRMVEAEKWFRYAIGRQPALVEAHYNLINLLVGAGRVDEARAAIAAAVKQAPSPRYGLFEGRLRSQQSHDEWNPDWMIPAIVIFFGSLVIYALYQKSRRRRRTHRH